MPDTALQAQSNGPNSTQSFGSQIVQSLGAIATNLAGALGGIGVAALANRVRIQPGSVYASGSLPSVSQQPGGGILQQATAAINPNVLLFVGVGIVVLIIVVETRRSRG